MEKINPAKVTMWLSKHIWISRPVKGNHVTVQRTLSRPSKTQWLITVMHSTLFQELLRQFFRIRYSSVKLENASYPMEIPSSKPCCMDLYKNSWFGHLLLVLYGTNRFRYKTACSVHNWPSLVRNTELNLTNPKTGWSGQFYWFWSGSNNIDTNRLK